MIEAPAAVVWAIYSDVDGWWRWNPSVTSSDIEPKGALAIGAVAKIKQPRFPEVAWSVDDVSPGASWRWSNVVPGSRATAGHDVVAIDPGHTRVDLWIDQRGVFGRLIGVAARRLTHQYLRAEADGLKAASEQVAAGLA